MRTTPVGSHVPVAGGLAKTGLAYAREIGAEAVQVFVANPRGWATPAGDPAQDELFRAECAAAGIPAYVHAPYLVNFGSHTAATVERSVESLRHSLRRGGGSARSAWWCTPARPPAAAPASEALAQVQGAPAAAAGGAHARRRPVPAAGVDGRAGRVDLLAGGGLRTVLRGARRPSEAGRLPGHLPCLRGRPRPRGPGRRGGDARRTGAGGGARPAEAGARQRLEGRGGRPQGPARQHRRPATLGEEPFRALMRHPAAEGVPLVIETPGGKEGHAADVARLKSLRDT